MWMFTGYGMGVAGWLLMALFWIALIALAVFSVVRLFPARTEARPALHERVEAPTRSSSVASPTARSTLTPTSS